MLFLHLVRYANFIGKILTQNRYVFLGISNILFNLYNILIPSIFVDYPGLAELSPNKR